MRRFGGGSAEKPVKDGSHGRNFGDSDFPLLLPFVSPALLAGDGDVLLRRGVGVEALEVGLLAAAGFLPVGVVGLHGDEALNVGLDLVSEGEDGLPLFVLVVLLVDEAVLGRRGLGFPPWGFGEGSCGYNSRAVRVNEADLVSTLL